MVGDGRWAMWYSRTTSTAEVALSGLFGLPGLIALGRRGRSSAFQGCGLHISGSVFRVAGAYHPVPTGDKQVLPWRAALEALGSLTVWQ